MYSSLAGPGRAMDCGQKIPGIGPGPQSGYDVRDPGNGGAGNLRPRSTEILLVMLGALSRRHLTRRSATLIHSHLHAGIVTNGESPYFLAWFPGRGGRRVRPSGPPAPRAPNERIAWTRE